MSVCAEHLHEMHTEKPVRAVSARRHFKDSTPERSCFVNVAVYRWLLDLVPETKLSSFVLRLFVLFGLLLKGSLLRSGSITLPCDASRGTEIEGANYYALACSFDSVQLELVKEWQIEALIQDRHSALRALMLMGSGVLGGLDGLVTAPWRAYKEWPVATPLDADIIERMAWVSGQTTYNEAAGDRPMPRDVDHMVSEMIIIMTLMGQRGWYLAEIEAGDISAPLEQLVSRERSARVLQHIRADVSGV